MRASWFATLALSLCLCVLLASSANVNVYEALQKVDKSKRRSKNSRVEKIEVNTTKFSTNSKNTFFSSSTLSQSSSRSNFGGGSDGAFGANAHESSEAQSLRERSRQQVDSARERALKAVVKPTNSGDPYLNLVESVNPVTGKTERKWILTTEA